MKNLKFLKRKIRALKPFRLGVTGIAEIELGVGISCSRLKKTLAECDSRNKLLRLAGSHWGSTKDQRVGDFELQKAWGNKSKSSDSINGWHLRRSHIAISTLAVQSFKTVRDVMVGSRQVIYSPQYNIDDSCGCASQLISCMRHWWESIVRY